MGSGGARSPEPGREMSTGPRCVQECDGPTQLLQDILMFRLTGKSFAKLLCHRKESWQSGVPVHHPPSSITAASPVRVTP